MTIAIDLLSAWQLPTTAAGWTTLLAGTGLANPTSAWGHQEASGHFVDGIGSNTSTSETGISYAVTVPNTSRKGVKCTSAGGAGKVLVPCLITNAHSQTLVQVFSIGSIPTGTAQALNCIGATQFEEAQLSLSRQIVGHSGGAIATGTIAENSIVIVVTKYDHTNSIFAVYTSTGQTLKPTYTAQGADVTTFLVGDGSNSSDSVCLFSAMFQDAAAEISDANVAVLMRKMRGASTVTRDAASGMWFPASTAEMTSLVGGRSALTGLAAAVVGIYNCQDASGAIVDATGTQNLTANAGGGTFCNAVTGYTRLAVRPTTGGAYSWANGLGPAGDTGTTSQVFLAHIHEYSAQSSDRDVISFQAGGGARGIVYTGGEKLKYVTNDASAVITGTANPSGGRWVLLQTDRTNNFNGVRTDQETLQQSPNTNPSAVANYVLVGASLSNGAFVDLLWMLTARGSGSELTSTGWAQLLDALNNGPAATAIAISPSAYTLGSIGATQQMASITTVADGSSYSSTTNVTWTSSNPAVATVSSSGLVTAIANGTATITAAFASLGAATITSSGVVATVSTGAVSLASVELLPAPVATLFQGGGTKQITAMGHYSDGSITDISTLVTWSSSATNVATVGAHTGLVTGNAPGSATITATYLTFTLTVTTTVLASAGAANDLDAQTANFYGEDIWFDIASVDANGCADYVVDRAGDWQDVEGVEALRQSLLRRLITNPGEWQTLPDFGVGARQYVKGLLNAATQAELEARVRQQFMSDDRVESLESVTIEVLSTGDAPALKISVVVIPVGRLRQDATLPVSISIT